MSPRNKNLFFDKGLDIIVVTVGVLIALSFGSCKESRRDQAQWQDFSTQLKRNITDEIALSSKDLDLYNQQIKTGKKLISDLLSNKISKKELLEYIEQFGNFNLSLPIANMYTAFLKLNNPYLMSDYDRFVKIDTYFNFKDTGQIYIDLYINQLTPDIRKYIKTNRIHLQNGILKNKVATDDTIFLLRSFTGLTGGLATQVEKHINDSKELLKML